MARSAPRLHYVSGFEIALWGGDSGPPWMMAVRGVVCRREGVGPALGYRPLTPDQQNHSDIMYLKLAPA